MLNVKLKSVDSGVVTRWNIVTIIVKLKITKPLNCNVFLTLNSNILSFTVKLCTSNIHFRVSSTFALKQPKSPADFNRTHCFPVFANCRDFFLHNATVDWNTELSIYNLTTSTLEYCKNVPTKNTFFSWNH